jgi:hypothetical protein
MADHTITVDSVTYGRLAALAAHRGRTIAEVLTDFALSAKPNNAPLTPEEREAQIAYIREHLIPDFGPADIEAGEQMWRDLKAGRLTHLGGPRFGSQP